MSIYALMKFIILCLACFASGIRVPLSRGTEEQPMQTMTMNVNSSLPTLVFPMGLEDSGHHLILALDRELKVPDLDLYKKYNFQDLGRHVYFVGLRGPQSYPQNMGSHHSRMYNQHPNIDHLIAAAREGVINFKAMLLKRDAHDTLAGKHGPENHSAQAETLQSNTDIMLQQWSNLNPEEQLCFEYGDLNEMESVIRQTFGSRAQTILDEIYIKGHGSGQRRDFENDEMYARMEDVNLKLTKMCKSAAQIPMAELARDMGFSHLGLIAKKDSSKPA